MFGQSVICIGFFIALFFILGTIALLRFFSLREKTILAKKGLLKPLNKQSNPRLFLQWGIIVTAIGMALTIIFIPTIINSWVDSDRMQLGASLVSFLPLFVGIALIILYYLNREKPGKNPM